MVGTLQQQQLLLLPIGGGGWLVGRTAFSRSDGLLLTGLSTVEVIAQGDVDGVVGLLGEIGRGLLGHSGGEDDGNEAGQGGEGEGLHFGGKEGGGGGVCVYVCVCVCVYISARSVEDKCEGMDEFRVSSLWMNLIFMFLSLSLSLSGRRAGVGRTGGPSFDKDLLPPLGRGGFVPPGHDARFNVLHTTWAMLTLRGPDTSQPVRAVIDRILPYQVSKQSPHPSFLWRERERIVSRPGVDSVPRLVRIGLSWEYGRLMKLLRGGPAPSGEES